MYIWFYWWFILIFIFGSLCFMFARCSYLSQTITMPLTIVIYPAIKQPPFQHIKNIIIIATHKHTHTDIHLYTSKIVYCLQFSINILIIIIIISISIYVYIRVYEALHIYESIWCTGRCNVYKYWMNHFICSVHV